MIAARQKSESPAATGHDAVISKNLGRDSKEGLKQFQGTENPRYLRAIHALMSRPRSREEVDSVAGCSNGPDLIHALRCLGLKIPCDRIHFIDRDGKPCRPGVYGFTSSDRRKIRNWQIRKQSAEGLHA